jgi:hypothetical protein
MKWLRFLALVGLMLAGSIGLLSPPLPRKMVQARKG